MLDLKQKVNRKTKQVECMVHYKKTHTNINIKEKSNHSPCVKKGIIKGFAGRALALFDDDHVEDELKNVEDVFVANRFEREKVEEFMKESKRGDDKDQPKEQECRGMVVVPYLSGLSDKFKRLATEHFFRTAFKPGINVKEVKKRA